MNRPGLVTVFGVLNIVFGIMGLTCTPLGTAYSLFYTEFLPENIPSMPQFEAMQELMNTHSFRLFLLVSSAVGMVASGVLLAAGIGLLKMKPWARVCSIGYAIYAFCSMAVGFVVNYLLLWKPMAEGMAEADGPFRAGMFGGMYGAVAGMCVSIVFPAALLICMFLPAVRNAFHPPELPPLPEV